MVREVELTKPKSILNKFWLYIVCILLSTNLVAQDDAQNVSQGDPKTQKWESEKGLLKYKKQEGYKGPNGWHGSSPADMGEDNSGGSFYGSSNRNGGGITYSQQRIQRDRERYQGFDRGGGQGGDLRYDPDVAPPDRYEMDPPDLPTPDADTPDLPSPDIPMSFWKVLLFIIVGALVVFLLYLIIKNYNKSSNERVIVDVEDKWNPEIITKTELELRLEEAMAREDYRECVRIYFTFILKELIRKSWIFWKKEKTNYHYFLEMHSKPNSSVFGECVRIYDLVWYGEYDISRENFEQLKPTLEHYYKSLDPKDE